VAALDTASSKGSDKPEVLKTRGNSGQFYPVLPEKFVPKKLCISKFMHIFTDDQGTFCLVFAFYFTSCYISNVLPQFGVS